MKFCECPQCGAQFEFTGASRDDYGWHTACPKCGGSFDVDVEDYLIEIGTPVVMQTDTRGTIIGYVTTQAVDFDDIQYLIIVDGTTYVTRLRRRHFSISPDWRLTRRVDGCVQRVCHYPKNKEHSNAPCYNCVDRAKCNADIFERLAQYEDSGLKPEELRQFKEVLDRHKKYVKDIQQLFDEYGV